MAGVGLVMTDAKARASGDVEQKRQSSGAPVLDHGTAKAVGVPALGGLITAVILVASLAPNARTMPGSQRMLAQVPQAEMQSAVGSLDASSGRLAEDARACRTPLAVVSVAAGGPSGAGAVVRIRSGTYVSPPITLAGTPQRVAVPYPAPYSAGAGVLQIEGKAAGAIVSLSPAWTVIGLAGVVQHNVVWTVGNPCS